MTHFINNIEINYHKGIDNIENCFISKIEKNYSDDNKILIIYMIIGKIDYHYY